MELGTLDYSLNYLLFLTKKSLSLALYTILISYGQRRYVRTYYIAQLKVMYVHLSVNFNIQQREKLLLQPCTKHKRSPFLHMYNLNQKKLSVLDLLQFVFMYILCYDHVLVRSLSLCRLLVGNLKPVCLAALVLSPQHCSLLYVTFILVHLTL